MKFLQPSLSGGEMAPGLHGRVDVARYLVSLHTCQNFITRPTGGAIKRPGFRYNGEAKTNNTATRILPFVYSTEIKYLVEAGVGYMRFWVPATPRGYALLRDGSNNIVEIATPYAATDLPNLRITQSADVLYIAGVNGTVKIPPKMLRRLTTTSFDLVDFGFRRGPFRSLNADTGIKMAVTATTGNITVTCNVGLFTAQMVGSLVYFEEQELRNVKPWTPLEKNVGIGALRRSDGKVFRCYSVPSVVAPAYYVCGNNKPLHETGRDFDGPQDTRNDGVNDYKVGVEWEYLHGDFGIAKITAFTSATQVSAVVVERLADSVVGTAPAPAAGPWTLSGDGVTKTFTIAGNSSDSPNDYTVTIGGVPIPADPYREAPGDGAPGGNIPGPPYEDGRYRQLP